MERHEHRQPRSVFAERHSHGLGHKSRWLPSWKAHAVGDFNADGHTDLIFQNDVTGQITGWLLSGTTLLQGAFTGQSSDWQVVGAK